MKNFPIRKKFEGRSHLDSVDEFLDTRGMTMRWNRYLLVVLCAVALLAGCREEKAKKADSKEREKATRLAIRAEEVRKRIDDLQHSLVQLYQETEIQQMKIRAAQENLAALRKSLGELASVSPDLARLTTGSIVATAPVEIPRLKKDMSEEPAKATKKKKERENRALETLLIIAFGAFLLTVGYKLYRRKTESVGQEQSNDAGTYTIIKPSSTASGEDASSESAPEKVEPTSPASDSQNESRPTE